MNKNTFFRSLRSLQATPASSYPSRKPSRDSRRSLQENLTIFPKSRSTWSVRSKRSLWRRKRWPSSKRNVDIKFLFLKSNLRTINSSLSVFIQTNKNRTCRSLVESAKSTLVFVPEIERRSDAMIREIFWEDRKSVVDFYWIIASDFRRRRWDR